MLAIAAPFACKCSEVARGRSLRISTSGARKYYVIAHAHERAKTFAGTAEYLSRTRMALTPFVAAPLDVTKSISQKSDSLIPSSKKGILAA